MGDVAWGITGAVGEVWSATLVIGALRAGRVDAIAIVGALLVSELFAAALITVMLATGRFLEARASGRARAELTARAARAPVDARRYSEGALDTVSLDTVRPGDLLLVRSGEVIPG